MILRASLPATRTLPGTLRLEHEGTTLWGPVPCFGKADNAGAIAHDNPTRNPLYAYGDSPLGKYRIMGCVPTGTDPEEIRKYGVHGKLVLDPVGGQALQAKENGRFGLLVHGGGLGGAAPYGFRPTYGCLRVLNDDMGTLVTRYRELKFTEYEAVVV